MELRLEQKKYFSTKLLKWSTSINRSLPWKATKDPYKIWLSEIILQQTRVEQGTPYYLKFVEQYPNVADLASADIDKVLKLWEGLGYYSRARNLHQAAQFIHTELGGIFPKDHKEILALKGVGQYTAAAIASFAYDLPYAVLDGNVFRVLARFFGLSNPIDTTQGKKLFAKLAQELLDIKNPAAYNQAIMDFGALQCTPKSPKCVSCPLQKQCASFADNTVSRYPVKSKKLKKRTRYFNFLLLQQDNKVLIEKRTQKDIWQGLYQFPLLETSSPQTEPELLQAPMMGALFLDEIPNLLTVSPPFKQTLTHQHIIARFWKFELKAFSADQAMNFQVVNYDELPNFAFPKIIDWYLRDNSLYLDLV